MKAYKIALKPNQAQLTLLRKHAGVARLAYNWALSKKIHAYKLTGKSPSAIDLHKQFNKLKSNKYSFAYEVSKCAPQEAMRDLDQAYSHFFRRCKKGENPGFPKFKKKGVKDSFRLTGIIKHTPTHVQLPVLGKIRLHEKRLISGRIISATISRDVNQWFVSLLTDEDPNQPNNSTEIVGCDLGIKTFATLSDETRFENPKILKKYEKKIKREQRNLSRKVLKSKNWSKQKIKLALLHKKVRNTRNDFLHKITTFLAKTKLGVVIEDLKVGNMLKNHNLAKSIQDVSWSEFRRMLTYKSKWYGCDLQVVGSFYPSSKICFDCKSKNSNLLLSDRTWVCSVCGVVHDRDLNAACNLRSKFVPQVLGDVKPVEKLRSISSVKQEVLTLQVSPMCKIV